MGAFLDKPKTEKTTLNGEGCGIRYGVSAMQGWRMEMEDSHVCNTSFSLKDHSFFGVFDGHAGPNVSKYCAANLLDCIMKNYKKSNKASLSGNEAIREAIRQGFLDLDTDLLKVPDLKAGNDRSGSTAVVVMITENKIIWGNCGDSRGILCRNGKVNFATQDHKPFHAEEKDRIERAGGTVMMQRVNGSLAVSRALGDFDYKRSTDLKAEQQLVSPEPEVTVLDRDEENDSFLFLACDGIYDVMSNEDVVAFVLHSLQLTDDLSAICSKLIDTCLNKNSRDNMSAILVTFPSAPKVSQKAIEEEESLQKEAMSCINARLEKMVNETMDPLDLEESYVIETLLTDFPQKFDIVGKRSHISEKLQELKKVKFGEAKGDFVGSSDPADAPNEFHYTGGMGDFLIQADNEPMGTSVDQKGDDPTITEVGLSPPDSSEKASEVKT